MIKIFSHLFVFLRSDSSDPKADDGDDQTAWDSVSSLQRRTSLPSLKQGGKPKEHSPKLCGLGVCRGTSSWPHIKPLLLFFISCFQGLLHKLQKLPQHPKQWVLVGRCRERCQYGNQLCCFVDTITIDYVHDCQKQVFHLVIKLPCFQKHLLTVARR